MRSRSGDTLATKRVHIAGCVGHSSDGATAVAASPRLSGSSQALRMTSLLSTHAAITGTWALLTMALCGIGLLYRRCFTTRGLDAQEMLTAFWTGFALVLFLLQVWHLVLPVNAGATTLILALGAAGLFREREALRA